MAKVVWCRLQSEPLDFAAMLAAAREETMGGVVLFSGDVRSITGDEKTERLFYEAYAEMALTQMQTIAETAAKLWNANIAVAHRTGEILPGESAVICVAACAHRTQAFECCRFLIDRIKEDVPIWKREG